MWPLDQKHKTQKQCLIASAHTFLQFQRYYKAFFMKKINRLIKTWKKELWVTLWLPLTYSKHINKSKVRFPIKWHPHTYSYLEFNYSLQFLFFSFTFFFPLTKAYLAKASASSQFTFIISINELIYNLSYANNRCSSKQIPYLSTLFSSPKTTLKIHNSSIITTINICCINGPSLGQTYIILLVAGPTIFFFCFSFYNFYNSFFKISIPGLDSFVGSFCFLFFHHSSIFINSPPTTCLGLIDKIHKCSRESVPCILHAPC